MVSGARTRALGQLRMVRNSLLQLLAAIVARVPAKVHAKLLIAFLAITVLLIALGAVGLQALSDTNQRAKDLVELQRKIAAYRQLQHDTTAQLYSVASALLVHDERTLTPRCASSISSATTSTGSSLSPKTRSSCSARCARTTISSSRW